MANTLLGFDITKTLEENFINLVKSANENEIFVDLINKDTVGLITTGRLHGADIANITLGGETIQLDYYMVVRGLPTGPLRGDQTIKYRRLRLGELNIPSLVGNGGDYNNTKIPAATIASRIGLALTNNVSTATAICNDSTNSTWNEFDTQHLLNYLKLHPRVKVTCTVLNHPNEGYRYLKLFVNTVTSMIDVNGKPDLSVFYHYNYDNSDFGNRGTIEMLIRRGV